jgi:hypothetical protein
LGLELPHEIGGGLNEVARGDHLEVLSSKVVSFVALVINMFGQLLLRCDKLEGELCESSKLNLIFRATLWNILWTSRWWWVQESFCSASCMSAVNIVSRPVAQVKSS